MVKVPAPAKGQSQLAATPLRILSVSPPQPEEAQEDVKRTCPRRGSPSSRHCPSDSGISRNATKAYEFSDRVKVIFKTKASSSNVSGEVMDW
ncbi:hypothetical protein RDI58_013245 [Solanum bulbocastanum]|uniref:Uncharacterized protein n=1 Tax=Solanum bulbocastanum TaxID=147425 RepID=A0AAN8YF21_SOLBU